VIEGLGSTYHVVIYEDTGLVDISALGINSVDMIDAGVYSSVDKLPHWLQERLARLMMFAAPPPISDVADLGCRVGRNAYWVYM